MRRDAFTQLIVGTCTVRYMYMVYVRKLEDNNINIADPRDRIILGGSQ